MVAVNGIGSQRRIKFQRFQRAVIQHIAELFVNNIAAYQNQIRLLGVYALHNVLRCAKCVNMPKVQIRYQYYFGIGFNIFGGSHRFRTHYWVHGFINAKNNGSTYNSKTNHGQRCAETVMHAENFGRYN